MDLSAVSRPRPLARRVAGVLGWVLGDALVWVVGMYAAVWLRYDFKVEPVLVSDTMMLFAVVTALGHAVLALLVGVYSQHARRGTFDEVRALTVSTALATSGLVALGMAFPVGGIPRTIPVILGLFACLIMMTTRSVARSLRELRVINRKEKPPIIIFGAGAAGRLLAHNLLNDDRSPFRPVAFLDDDRAKQRRRIHGIPVRGRRDRLAKVAARTQTEHMVIAIPSATRDVIGDLQRCAEDAGVTPLVLPSLSEMMGRRSVTGEDIRQINLEDLLGRRPITLNLTEIGEALNRRRILVTGAGGSIGSELCRQLTRFTPAELVLLDRDESALQGVTLGLDGDALLDKRNVVLCDIRDSGALARVFAEHQPQIVFHAAALKHLPLLEAYPDEAWKTNVLGTLNVLEAARRAGVETFVNISTDKAAAPTSNLGYSKRIAERITAGYALRSSGRYLSVRFGNVLGSRGSVVPAFQAQIARGGPVTVTHPDVERFFMLIPEACQLVMQAAAIGGDGEVMVLDMGSPVRILDVAQTLISMSGKRIRIEFSGLRAGEKMTEDLFHSLDDQRSTRHPLVSAVDVPPLTDELRDVSLDADAVAVLRRFALADDIPDDARNLPVIMGAEFEPDRGRRL
jgi:FlaA1/EpsC-like NDP-sugar epimerase